MKRRHLPFTLVLIFIVIGGITTGFLMDGHEQEYTVRKQNEQIQNRLGKPGSQFLAQVKNNQHTGVINPSDIKRMREGMENLSYSRAATIEWKQMGPDNYAGRTRAILCQEVGSTVVTYAAGVTGGIWKSENLGTTWQKVNASNDNLNVSCIAESSKGDIYVGTGESFDPQTVSGLEEMGYTSGFMGQGIFKSTDGDNFTLIKKTKPTFNDIDSDWAYVNEIAINQSNDRIWAATNTGLKYSNDEGSSWTTATDDQGTALDKASWDVQVGSDGAVVACVDNLCYVSLNGQDKFVLRSTGDSLGLPESGVSRIEFAIAPSDPNIVYASVVGTDNDVYNIYKSENKGIDWEIIMPGTNSIDVFGGQGVYNNALGVFPNDPGKVMLGGIDSWQGTMFTEEGFYDWKTISQSLTDELFPTFLHEDVHTYEFVPNTDNEFFVGTDGGVYLGILSSGNYIYETGNRNYFTTQFYAVGPSGEKHYMIGGTQDVGTLKITGEGNTEMNASKIFDGEGGPCAVSVINRDYLIVSTTDGIFRRSDDGGLNYSSLDQFPTDDISNAAFRTPYILSENFTNEFSSDTAWYFARDTIPGGTKIQVRSENGGQPFPYITPDNITMYPGDSLPVKDIVTSYLFLGVRHNILLATNVVRFDETVEWFELSNPDYGFIGAPYSMALSSDGNHLFVGTNEGRLYRISNLATANTYERADVNSPGCIVSTKEIVLTVPGSDENVSQVITGVSIDADDHNNVIITLGNYGNEHYVMYSENGLSENPEFNSRQGDLPVMPIYSAILEMSDPNMAFVGTEMGIFMTENIKDENPQWSESTSQMGRVPVFELKQQTIDQPTRTVTLVNGGETTYITYPGTNNFGSIYVASYGRGLFRSDDFYLVNLDDNFDEQVLDGTLKLYPNPVRTSATIDVEVSEKEDAIFYVYDLSGRMVLSKSHFLNKGLNHIRLDLERLESGPYFVKTIIGGQAYNQKFIVN